MYEHTGDKWEYYHGKWQDVKLRLIAQGKLVNVKREMGEIRDVFPKADGPGVMGNMDFSTL